MVSIEEAEIFMVHKNQNVTSVKYRNFYISYCTKRVQTIPKYEVVSTTTMIIQQLQAPLLAKAFNLSVYEFLILMELNMF